MDKFGGVLIKARDTGRVFLLLRSTTVRTPLVWSLISGGIEEGEEVLEGLKREIDEETKIDASIIEFEEVGDEPVSKGTFYYYKGLTDSEFIPTLCEENLDWGWFDKDDLPEPLHPDMGNKIDEI